MITNHLSEKLVESVYQKLLFHLGTDNYSGLWVAILNSRFIIVNSKVGFKLTG